ncbi:MAG: 30S ribosomal protein S24e [Thermoprotei archaeon]|nr:MAG: 30S ribosomal protein S24e [Thermoprotei archaeon]RLF01056.1 MAG: 30S ribosomal protein S24e [Thermoprotei archaeon]HDI74317.1 30S ribosomal protein S24e [Thermoprotei archaeon]
MEGGQAAEKNEYGFEIEIVRERVNPLLERRELEMTIHHFAKSTPKVYDVRQYLSKQLKVDLNTIYIRKIITEFGVGRSRAEVHIYRTPERAQKVEPLHIILKNLPPEERKKKLEELKRKS